MEGTMEDIIKTGKDGGAPDGVGGRESRAERPLKRAW